MSLHKTQSGWRVRWREGTRNRSRSFTNHKVAKNFDAVVRVQRQVRGVEEIAAQDVILEDYAAEWWTSYAKPNLAPRTLTVYATALDLRVVPHLGHLPLRQVTPARVEEWLARLRRDGVGDPSIIKAATVLQAILRRAELNGLVDGNAARVVRKPRQTVSRRPAPIPPVVVEAIRSQLELYDATLVSVLAYAGLRPESEAVALRWADVGERTLAIRASKTGRARQVRLLKPLASDLKAWRKNGEGTLVFPRPGGGPWSDDDWTNWLRRVYRPAAVAAGLPEDTRPRDLRGSFASLLISEGRNVVEVARELGHSPNTCLSAYAGLFAEVDVKRQTPAEKVIATARKAARPDTVSPSRH